MQNMNNTAILAILCGLSGIITLINQQIPESPLQYALFFISGLIIALILVLVFKIFSSMKNQKEVN